MPTCAREGASETCASACYRCLYNQGHLRLLDTKPKVFIHNGEGKEWRTTTEQSTCSQPEVLLSLPLGAPPALLWGLTALPLGPKVLLWGPAVRLWGPRALLFATSPVPCATHLD
ncbi:unnamed protein product [Arctogadus glacialis]